MLASTKIIVSGKIGVRLKKIGMLLKFKHFYVYFAFLMTTCIGVALAAETVPDNTLRIKFSEQEIAWISKNPIIYYSDDNQLPPFVYLTSEGVLDGIATEYLKLIEINTQLRFEFVASKNWTEVIDRLKNHHIHLVLAAIYSEERRKFANFSESYFTAPMAIVTNSDYSYIQDMNELNGKTIALPEGFYTNLFLEKNYPEIMILPVKDVIQALKAVNDGKADAFIGNLGIAIYNLKNTIYSNLKISGSFDGPFAIRFMGALADPELISIIDKALKLITASQKRNIENSWFDVEFDQGINPQTLWQVVAVFTALILLVLVWVKRLKSEVLFRSNSEINLREAQQKAEQANIAKTNFLANMSHEIRTPMNAISGFTQLLELTKLDQEQKSYINSIHIGTDALLHVINDILDISEIEHGKIKLHPEAINIKTLIEETMCMFSSEFKSKSLKFHSSFEGDISQNVIVDKNRLRQIIINLVANALKFTKEGSVSINLNMPASESNEDIDIDIEVIDTGIGIDNKRLKQIFEKFVHHESIKSEYYQGTGLGLTISQKLAQLLGGDIRVTSKVGKGSRFNLSLTLIKSE